MTQRSSACREVWGSQSEIHRPFLPCCFHFRLGARRVLSEVPMAVMTRPKDLGMGWPARRSRAGLGSHVSRCEGPPSMKRKMTDLALGMGCFGLGVEVAADASR